MTKDYSKFVEIGPSVKKRKRKPFSDEEIKTLWQIADAGEDEYVQIILMLIYSGLRITELLDLKKKHVHLEEQYIEIVRAKSEAGVRKVPIATKVLPFWQTWMAKRPRATYLLFTREGTRFNYNQYWASYWNPFVEEQGMYHTPHETRHTTISLLTRANVNQTIIKLIVGHAGANVIN